MRTWNVFHGNAVPPERRAFVAEMVRLASDDRPDVLCLQELPAWALRRLATWSGMATAAADVASRPPLGALVGRFVTATHHGLLRSAVSGQGNAILVGARLQTLDRDSIVLNPHSFRAATARALALGPLARVRWARERRSCQAVRLRHACGRTFVVANLHATSHPDRRIPDAELRRAVEFTTTFARDDEPCIVAGDFNVSPTSSETMRAICSEGFSATQEWIDHVLVRGAAAAPPELWPEERRRFEGRLLSDHAPVEVRVDL